MSQGPVDLQAVAEALAKAVSAEGAEVTPGDSSATGVEPLARGSPIGRANPEGQDEADTEETVREDVQGATASTAPEGVVDRDDQQAGAGEAVQEKAGRATVPNASEGVVVGDDNKKDAQGSGTPAPIQPGESSAIPKEVPSDAQRVKSLDNALMAYKNWFKAAQACFRGNLERVSEQIEELDRGVLTKPLEDKIQAWTWALDRFKDNVDQAVEIRKAEERRVARERREEEEREAARAKVLELEARARVLRLEQTRLLDEARNWRYKARQEEAPPSKPAAERQCYLCGYEGVSRSDICPRVNGHAHYLRVGHGEWKYIGP